MFVQKILNNNLSFSGYTKRIPVKEFYRNNKNGDIDSINLPRHAYLSKGDIEDFTPRKNIADATVDIYYAEPGEAITDKIRQNHSYILQYVDMPKQSSISYIKSISDADKMNSVVKNIQLLKDLLEEKNIFCSKRLVKAQDNIDKKFYEYKKAKADYEDILLERYAIVREIDEEQEKLMIAKNRLLNLRA